MGKPPKLSGTELLAELTGAAIERKAPTPAPASRSANAPYTAAAGGRPRKIAGDAVPLTVRVSQAQLTVLRQAALERARASEGQATVTAQDIVRLVLDRALADPGFLESVSKGTP